MYHETGTHLAGSILDIRSRCLSVKYKMFLRIFLYLFLLVSITACSVMQPRYDDVISLTPGLEERGNSLLRIQTLLSTGPESIILLAENIDGHQVGVKYVYYRDFKKLPNFPETFSFGNRLVIIPPGTHIIEIHYSSKSRYLNGSGNQEHSQMISLNATVPVDSMCVLLPEFDSYKIDLYKPKIRLECREKQNLK
jgi:hypothetical protein